MCARRREDSSLPRRVPFEAPPHSTPHVLSVTGDTGGGGAFAWEFDVPVAANNSAAGELVFELYDSGIDAWVPPDTDNSDIDGMTAYLSWNTLTGHFTQWRVRSDTGAIVVFDPPGIVADSSGPTTST